MDVRDFTDAIGNWEGRQVSIRLTDGTHLKGILLYPTKDSVCLRDLYDKNHNQTIFARNIAYVDRVKVNRWKGAREGAGFGLLGAFIGTGVIEAITMVYVPELAAFTSIFIGIPIGALTGGIIGNRDIQEYRLQVEENKLPVGKKDMNMKLRDSTGNP